MANPWLENLRQIKNVTTGKTFACTAKNLHLPYDWRTAITDVPNADGGVDAHVGSPDYLKSRTIDTTLVHAYAAGESFKTVMTALETVIGRGHPLELTFVENDGTIWLWDVRLAKFDKRHTLDWSYYVEIPLQFIAADPRQRAVVKPGTLLLDNGLFLDATPTWYLDTDPDLVLLSGTTTTHTITNTVGTAPDEAPIVDLSGPITGPVVLSFTADDGSVVSWTYNASVAAGEHVRVDATQPEVTSSNAAINAYANFFLGSYSSGPGPTRQPPNQSSWGRITPGTNTLTLTCGGYSAPASFLTSWAPRK